MSNVNSHIQAPLFIGRDYYDIPRAARMLGVEESDIYHWVDGCYIGLYIHVSGHFFNMENEKRLPSYWYEEVDTKANEVWDADFNSLDSDMRDFLAKDSTLVAGEGVVTECWGWWRVSSMVLHYGACESFLGYSANHIIIFGETERFDPGETERFDFVDKLNTYLDGHIDAAPSDYSFALAAKDVHRLYNFLYRNEPLERLKRWSSDKEKTLSRFSSKSKAALTRKPRTQAEHLALIEALIRSHPDIDAELLKQPSQLHKTLGELFARQSIHYPIESQRTYARWFKTPEDS